MREPKEDRDMTTELTARIVKVCEKIGIDLRYVDYGCTQEEYAESNLRHWLCRKWDRVRIEDASSLPFKHRIECGMSGEITARVRVAGNDYLDLLLTAVERTLE